MQLLGYWGSPFALRVKWALKLKGIQYEYLEEDLPNKSPMLLELNPVLKKVPVLVHNGKPLAESLVIIEYIDETWTHNPLMPKDPYERAKARFWAKFADEKVSVMINSLMCLCVYIYIQKQCFLLYKSLPLLKIQLRYRFGESLCVYL